MHKLIIAGALVAFAGSAVAGDDPFPKRFKPNQYTQVVELIETNMQPGGEFESTADEQARVRTLLGEIGSLLQGNERLADLDQNEKDAIEKRRAAINTILVANMKREVAARTQPAGKRPRKAADMLEGRPAVPEDY
ncbi:MAG TPA: hypothetical protein VND91_12840 [Candidatus Saccharimonadia bacterium]|nr:hypothetical protein [Candidatus Saccharimonadia bacterium]